MVASVAEMINVLLVGLTRSPRATFIMSTLQFEYVEI